jgi:pimeloyl-ACP methyl ester carboxylesterase
MPPAERLVPLRGGALRIRALTAGRGAPLVFFHSFEGLPRWPEFLDRLAARYTVWAPLHPGVDGSEGVEALDDILDLVLAYDEWLAALGLVGAHLAGHFFGGMVAAELAALFPGRARRLALLSPMGLWLEGLPQEDVLALPPAELHPLLWKDPEAPVARQWAARPSSEEARGAAQIERIQRLAAMGKFVWPLPDKGLKKRLGRIAAPTLLLWGDADRVNPVAYGEAFARGLEHALVRILPGGHMLLWEAPEAAAEAVAAFLG